MKRFFPIAIALMLSISVMGQQPIALRSTEKAECVSSDYQQLKASFRGSRCPIPSSVGTKATLKFPS